MMYVVRIDDVGMAAMEMDNIRTDVLVYSRMGCGPVSEPCHETLSKLNSNNHIRKKRRETQVTQPR